MGWAGFGLQRLAQPWIGFQHEGRLQADDARRHAQEFLSPAIQGRHATPLVHPQQTRGKGIQEPLVDRAQFSEGSGQFAPLPQAARDRREEQGFRIPRHASPQADPAEGENQERAQHRSDGQGHDQPS